MRNKQQGNPAFAFLEPANPAFAYYRHVLNCLMNGGWNIDQIIQTRNQQLSQMAPPPPPAPVIMVRGPPL